MTVRSFEIEYVGDVISPVPEEIDFFFNGVSVVISSGFPAVRRV